MIAVAQVAAHALYSPSCCPTPGAVVQTAAAAFVRRLHAAPDYFSPSLAANSVRKYPVTSSLPPTAGDFPVGAARHAPQRLLPLPGNRPTLCDRSTTCSGLIAAVLQQKDVSGRIGHMRSPRLKEMKRSIALRYGIQNGDSCE